MGGSGVPHAHCQKAGHRAHRSTEAAGRRAARARLYHFWRTRMRTHETYASTSQGKTHMDILYSQDTTETGRRSSYLLVLKARCRTVLLFAAKRSVEIGDSKRTLQQ